MIVKRGTKWILYTHDGSRVLGTHPSRAAALRQERAVQARQHAWKNPSELVLRRTGHPSGREFEATSWEYDWHIHRADGYLTVSVSRNGWNGERSKLVGYWFYKPVGDRWEYDHAVSEYKPMLAQAIQIEQLLRQMREIESKPPRPPRPPKARRNPKRSGFFGRYSDLFFGDPPLRARRDEDYDKFSGRDYIAWRDRTTWNNDYEGTREWSRGWILQDRGDHVLFGQASFDRRRDAPWSMVALTPHRLAVGPRGIAGGGLDPVEREMLARMTERR